MFLSKLLRRINNRLLNIFKKLSIFITEDLLIYAIVRRRYNRLPSSIQGYHNVLSKNIFYKIALDNPHFFLEEKVNIDLIRRKYPEIIKIIPNYSYWSIFRNRINVMKTQKLISISGFSEKFEAARNILSIFKKYGRIGGCTIGNLPYVLVGLKLVGYFCGEEVSRKAILLAKNFLDNNQFRLGPCHGDFHHKNVMSIARNNFVIDLDCFRDIGLQELDAMYFATQYIADNENTIWHIALMNLMVNETKYLEYYNFLEEFMDIDKFQGYSLTYLLDRLGQDAKYLPDPDMLPKDGLVDTILYLVDTSNYRETIVMR
jgi:hypothetical protein